MRKTTAIGNVSNRFVDKNPPAQPTGTRFDAPWANDVQDELIGIQEYAGIAEAAGTNHYILAAIKRAAIEYGKQIGELFHIDNHQLPAAFDKNSPDNYFPGKCLDSIDKYEDIAAANWPDLVPHLRVKKIAHRGGTTGEVTDFSVTNWAIASNVVTLTFANSAAEIAMLTALAEDYAVHIAQGGTYADWRTITLPSAIGSVLAGDYALSGVSSSVRTVTFAHVASNGSGSVTAVANFYEHRIVGSTTTARLFEASGRTLVGPNDDNDECVPGLRRRDMFQGHVFDVINGSGDGILRQTGTYGPGSLNGLNNDSSPPFDFSADNIKSDGTNGPPRYGKTTHSADIPAHLYIWGRRYVA